MSHTITVENVSVSGLARRQAEALAHTACGRTAKETARLMQISPRTVEMHLLIAQDHLGARNRLHLITQAIAAGAMRIRDTGAMIALAAVLSLVSIPGGDADDWARVQARPVRVRAREGEA